MKNPYFSLTVFILAAFAAGWLYPGHKMPELVPKAVAAGEPKAGPGGWLRISGES